MKSSQIAGGGNKNEPFDFYPTPPDATHALMLFLKSQPITIWEPACGDGAMAEVLASYGHAVIATDLRHAGYGTGGVDFLEANVECDAIITNPPFGIAEEFIRHAVSQTNTVAMLLKAHYWHAAKRKRLFSQHPPAYVLPLTWRPNFMAERGRSPTMDFQWTVWLPASAETRYVPLAKPRIDTAVNLPHNAST